MRLRRPGRRPAARPQGRPVGRGRQTADPPTRPQLTFYSAAVIEEPKINRNLALELLRVTEAGALSAAPLQGRGNKEAADRRAVEAIRESLSSVDMKGTVVIGEGEKDEAPMLFFGEEIGNGLGPEVDVAVDPIEGTSLTASGLPGAISVVALAERGTMLTTHVHYMDKLVVGRKARGVIDLEMPVEWNLRRIAKAEGLPVQELTVVVLERDRNKEVIAQIRGVGARIKLISAGDVAGALEAALETRFGIHCMMGSGGATEGVLAACAIKTIGGDMQARLHFRDAKEREMAVKEGHKPDKVLCIDDLCSGKDVFFAATGITTGELLKGVRYEDVYAYTQSMVLRSTSGTMRIVDAYHPIDKLRVKGLLPEQVRVR
ncbi:MAG: class II fructose-bisphosphatase [Chloroflexi bacterium]|nr:MAG: class II fructose-bisphosphatase [Chloroflexota bacterium]